MRGYQVGNSQEMLGHAKLESTQVYTRVSIQKLKDVHHQSHPAEKSWRDPRLPARADAGPLIEADPRALLDALAAEAAEEDEPDDP